MFRRIFDIVGPYRRTLAVGLIFKVLEAIFTNLGFLVVYIIVARLVGGQFDSGQIWVWLGVLALAYFFQGVCYQGNNVMNQKIFLRLKKEWRISLMEHLRRQPLGFYSRRQTGDLATILTKDVEQIELLPELFFTELTKNLALPLVSAVIFYLLDWRMATAVVLGAVLTIPVFYFSRKVTRQITDALAHSNGQVAARAIEYIQGMAVLKSFNRTGENFSELEKAFATHRRASVDQIIKLIPAGAASFFFLRLGFPLVFMVGAFLFLGGNISLAVLILFLLLSLRFYAPLIQLIDFSYTMGKTASALERVYSVLDAQPLPEPAQGQEKHLSNFDIEFKEVSFRYEDKPVLGGVSFRAPQNTITALVGPSGSGKTTITNLIARFWDVNSGEVKIGGENIKNLKTDYLLSQISIVFQNVYLFNDTIESNIKLGQPEATRAMVVEAARAARCHDFIEKLPDGYATMVGEGGATLSGGEKQRLSIARAILKDAPIVLLDEATASVDPENEHLIQEAFNALTAHKTLIIIAHRLNTITHADQILVLENGKIREQGRHSELIKADGLYSRYWAERQKARSWKVIPSLSKTTHVN